VRERGFSPVVGARPRLLVLGSLPGRASLAAGEYYAQPRNQFWRLLGELIGASPTLPYADRLAVLKRADWALWDVIESCEREGSLDASIVMRTVRTNDFAAFHARHPTIELIGCNGATAERLYRRRVLPGLEGRAAEIPLVRLPSTSPANASLSYERKRESWARALANVRK
jgi:TDG/mug DNA glycosylase family protein